MEQTSLLILIALRVIYAMSNMVIRTMSENSNRGLCVRIVAYGHITHVRWSMALKMMMAATIVSAASVRQLTLTISIELL